MIFFFQGKGLLVPLAFFLSSFVGALVILPCALILGHTPAALKTTNVILAFTDTLAAAGINHLFTTAFATPRTQTLIDEATGERFVLTTNRAAFFFIPNRYWTYIMSIIGLAITIYLMLAPA